MNIQDQFHSKVAELEAQLAGLDDEYRSLASAPSQPGKPLAIRASEIATKANGLLADKERATEASRRVDGAIQVAERDERLTKMAFDSIAFIAKVKAFAAEVTAWEKGIEHDVTVSASQRTNSANALRQLGVSEEIIKKINDHAHTDVWTARPTQ